jgi:hypothetical protein
VNKKIKPGTLVRIDNTPAPDEIGIFISGSTAGEMKPYYSIVDSSVVSNFSIVLIGTINTIVHNDTINVLQERK